MTSFVVKIVGAIAGAAWGLLFVLMLVLTFAIGSRSGAVTVAFVGVPAVMAAAALCIAFRSGFWSGKLALAIEFLLLVAGATGLLTIAAASGG
ncbi:MAG: hypothetical protein EOO77_04450 [Oxalobacteraceae bacterium]|nr:MAG: hypothetical protein EOO77_04450 [Oxalobacteraceae bacterium]